MAKVLISDDIEASTISMYDHVAEWSRGYNVWKTCQEIVHTLKAGLVA